MHSSVGHLFVGSLVCWFIGPFLSFVHGFVGLLFHWFVGLLVVCSLVRWLFVHWSIGSLTVG